MKSVLIVCTSNKTRSPMAMEIANKLSRERNAEYSFKSAGVAVIGSHVDDNVVEVLREIEIETNHTPVHISALDIDSFDAIHVMTQRQKITLCSYYSDKDIEDKITVLDISDPYYNGIQAYRDCRDSLMEFYKKYIK